ncbi:diguanylate cyclase, partial [Vibrio parahaemolyticus]|nr:diguanylate cyclase [Vibrio parahaemolyticus]MDG3400133.1 diguanylate cyclase [Vibrio parahaemolyticus]
SGTQVHSITASFGVAEFEVGDTVDSLVNKADKQLYEAKQLGRNRVMPI